MEKHIKGAYLLDIYEKLLTEKQALAMNLFYNEDLSMSEIADELSVSRQAAFDLIKRTQKILEDYDSKLNLLDKYLRCMEILDEISGEVTDIEGGGKIEELIDKIRNIL
ncbi:MAG: YlxM family DNA-binding protein [Eubacteriaceae bacterium]|nr:YlxM family DNA-binding protein [Eubacteriaceae bacterium]